MNSTLGETRDINDKHSATFYDIENGSYKESYPVDNSNKWAGGGFLSTPSDLVRMAIALQTSEFISQKTKQKLWTPVAMSNPRIQEESYAYGWRSTITNEINGKKLHMIHHAGTANGSTSVLVLFPEYELSISVLTNKAGNTAQLFNIAYEYAREIINDH